MIYIGVMICICMMCQILISLSDSECDTMIVVIDNTSKTKRFLPKLLAHLDKCGIAYTTARTFAQLHTIPKERVCGYVLSGSTLNIQNMSMDQYLMNLAAIQHHNVPVVGVCLGAQFLQVHYGGKLYPLQKVYCEDIDVNFGKTIVKARFCNKYAIQDVATNLRTLATYDVENQKLVCMFKHKRKPHYGILFHPEEHTHTAHLLTEIFRGIRKCGKVKAQS